MDILEVNTPELLEKLKSLELKVWKGSSDIDATELIRHKRAYIFRVSKWEVGYLIYSYRGGRAYIEDLVISDSSFFIPIIRRVRNYPHI